MLSNDEFNAVRKSAQGGAIHAGEWETSLVLHISPEVVDMSRATDADAMRYHSDFVAGVFGALAAICSACFAYSSEVAIF